jgi:hypothetical protein
MGENDDDRRHKGDENCSATIPPNPPSSKGMKILCNYISKMEVHFQVKPSILFIGKKNDFFCECAMEFVKLHFSEHEILLGKKGEPFPEEAGWWRGDYIVSYLSPWIIPEHLLKRASKASINFHPGPPEYRELDARILLFTIKSIRLE